MEGKQATLSKTFQIPSVPFPVLIWREDGVSAHFCSFLPHDSFLNHLTLIPFDYFQSKNSLSLSRRYWLYPTLRIFIQLKVSYIRKQTLGTSPLPEPTGSSYIRMLRSGSGPKQGLLSDNFSHKQDLFSGIFSPLVTWKFFPELPINSVFILDKWPHNQIKNYTNT